MLARTLVCALVSLVLAAPAWAAGVPAKEPPGGAYRQVSKLVKLPEHIPGLGKLYVNPKTLPVGPFLAYDKTGRLVSTIYMVPIADLNARKKMERLTTGSDSVKRVDLYYNAGHPGVAAPHYHIILWHVAPGDAKL